jgi:hypothetical protein
LRLFDRRYRGPFRSLALLMPIDYFVSRPNQMRCVHEIPSSTDGLVERRLQFVFVPFEMGVKQVRSIYGMS